MKQVISLLIITAILLQSFSSLMVIAGYEVNRYYIAKNLCENKSKPKMHCNGKCHLKKELIAQEQNQENAANPTKEKQETIQFFQIASDLKVEGNLLIVEHHSFYIPDRIQSVVFSFFHPPTV